MPLSPASNRTRLHTRRYHFDGFLRSDGLWDIEGRITDVKSYAFPNEFRGEIKAEEPLHDMSIRLTIDDEFTVLDIEAVTDSGPFEICPAVTPNFKRMIGVTIGPGWRHAIRKNLGGTEGCTHLVELLGAMATVAYQTLYPTLSKRNQGQPPSGQKPALLNSCHAFASDGELVKQRWPAFYTGASSKLAAK